MIRTKIFGGLCCVSFAITALANLAEQRPYVEAKTSTDGSIYCQVAEQSATKLVAVTSATCPPCQRLKRQTLPVLSAEGYDVTWVSFREWEGPKVERVPTLFYFDSDNNIIFTEVGFRTAKQVKGKLRKP